MVSWLHPGLLVKVTTPRGERGIWFDDRFTHARVIDEATQARLMRLQRVRLGGTLVLAAVVLAWLALAVLSGDAGEVNPLPFLAGFAAPAGLLSAVFTRAQRRHVDRQPLLTLPPTATARLQAVGGVPLLGAWRQRAVACKVAAEMAGRLGKL